MKLATLDDWLDTQLAGHPTEIELGLERVAAVAGHLSLLDSSSAKTLTVGGTNGKGSVTALAAGLIGSRARIGVYTSPHMWRYNERIVIDGRPAADEDIMAAFEAIAAARDGIALTFFEWATLAALWLFAQQAVDVRILEVGLGGRLDAVNIIDADVAVVTSIGIDHTDWLGDTRDAIGFEKAGIFRPGQWAICGDRDPPRRLLEQAQTIGARLRCIGEDFDIEAIAGRWRYREQEPRLRQILDAEAGVFADNLASAIFAVRALGYEVGPKDVRCAAHTQRTSRPGRREKIDADIPIVYDVAHNEQAVALLVQTLAGMPCSGRTHLVIGMLSDKPVEAVASQLRDAVDVWYAAGLSGASPRGLSEQALAARLGVQASLHDNPGLALDAARHAARKGDRIVVCGSFFTVARARSPEQ